MQESKYKDTLQIEYGTNKEYFAVRVCSDEMINAHVQRGAVVVLRKQRFAESGNIVLVVLNGKALFRYYKELDGDLYLTAANNDILPLMVRKTDDLTILGKVCEIRFAL